MEGILKKNMHYLEKQFPHVVEVLGSYEDVNPKHEVRIEAAKNGLMNIKVVSENYSIFLHSNYDQEKEAETLLKTLNLENKDTLIIIGFGMGYHIEKIIRTYPNMNKLIIEPNPGVFECVLKHKEIINILKAKNVELLLADNPDQIVQELIALYQKGHINSVEFFVLPSYRRLYEKLLQQTQEKYVRFLRLFSVNVRTSLLFAKEWIRNFLLNLNHIPNSADLIDMSGKFANIPAILVSAGPSLNKNIKLLQEVSNRALIIASGSTISIMQNAGIKPHIMFGIDGSQKMTNIFSKVEWTDIIFAYTLTLHSGSLEYYKGPKLYTRTNAEPHVEWMEKEISHVSPVLSSGGSCANVALDFAKKLGCNPVVFIGQDLAFTETEFYADGHIRKQEVDVSKFDSSRVKKVKDIYGNDIYTAHNLLTMAYCFEKYIGSHAADSIYINATEGGLPLKGTRLMTLREAIDQYCKQETNIGDMLISMTEESSAANKKLTCDLKRFIIMLKEHSDNLDRLSKQRLNLVEVVLADIKKNKLNKVSECGKKLLSLTQEIEEDDLFQRFLLHSIQDILLVIKNKYESLANRTFDTKEKIQFLYQGLKDQFEILNEMNKTINHVCNDAINRLEEEVQANV